MPTGAPDFGAKPSGSTSPSFDTGEDINHALMGGGNNSRSGRWVWASGFEEGSVSGFLVGGVNAPTVSNVTGTWQGKYVLRSQTQAILNDENAFYKYFVAAIAPGKWGLEMMFSVNSLNSEVDFVISNYSPTLTYKGTIRVAIGATASDIKLQYKDAAGIYQDLAILNTNFAVSQDVFHSMKLIVDFSKNEYVRVILDGTAYEMNISTYGNGTLADVRNSWIVYHRTKTAGVSSALFDNVILTADEP